MGHTRIEKLLTAATGLGAAAVLLTTRENMRYFSGFTGEGMVILSKDYCAVVTDSRYTEAAQHQAKGFDVVEFGHGRYMQTVADCVVKTHADKLGYEDEAMTVSTHRLLTEKLTGVCWVPIGQLGTRIRAVKDEGELAILRRACALTDEAYSHIQSFIRPGLTEMDVEAEMNHFLGTRGARPSFDMIVAAGVNGSMPHAETGLTVIQSGDMVTLDFGAMIDGYHADMTRTLAVGQPSDRMREIYAIVLEAQQAAESAARAGMRCCDVDAIARDKIAAAGYGECFGHGLGHGVGLQIHEEPRLSPICAEVLEPNMVVTIEPGIYLPGVGGVRIENTCIVHKDGCEPLFTSTKELIVL